MEELIPGQVEAHFPTLAAAVMLFVLAAGAWLVVRVVRRARTPRP